MNSETLTPLSRLTSPIPLITLRRLRPRSGDGATRFVALPRSSRGSSRPMRSRSVASAKRLRRLASFSGAPLVASGARRRRTLLLTPSSPRGATVAGSFESNFSEIPVRLIGGQHVLVTPSPVSEERYAADGMMEIRSPVSAPLPGAQIERRRPAQFVADSRAVYISASIPLDLLLGGSPRARRGPSLRDCPRTAPRRSGRSAPTPAPFHRAPRCLDRTGGSMPRASHLTCF